MRSMFVTVKHSMEGLMLVLKDSEIKAEYIPVNIHQWHTAKIYQE